MNFKELTSELASNIATEYTSGKITIDTKIKTQRWLDALNEEVDRQLATSNHLDNQK